VAELIDPRNLLDQYKGRSNQEIIDELDKTRLPIEIAIENLSHDFNMGSIVRTANAFNVRKVHIIGVKRWNRRGAMVTDRYMHVDHYSSATEFQDYTRAEHLALYGLENNVESVAVETFSYSFPCCLVFGSEGGGITPELLSFCDTILSITQFGSTRSINVGAAAAIAIYDAVTKLTKNRT
jgi:tRNA G18 (ribose-2'-O)-methylase SpoU